MLSDFRGDKIIMNEKILLVDDNYTVIKILTKFLEEEGYNVFSTTDSANVIRTVREISPDVLLLDVVMPVLDGFEICRLMKNDIGISNIPIIILTAETDSRDIKRAVELGAIDYIRKPVEKVEVIARVQSACRIKNYEDKLRSMVEKDGLTGIYNHTFLLSRFDAVYDSKLSYGCSLSFAMIDIDFFKKINDKHGHAAGDAVLKELALILVWGVGENGIIGRYGGEEFGVIVPDKSMNDTYLLLNSIRKDIGEYDFFHDGKTIKVTVSMGICFSDALKGTSPEELIKLADGSLYKAKNSGRNRTVICSA